jgi:CelD/BcsL family acetyltransferase involved in cellulose biosynthesis
MFKERHSKQFDNLIQQKLEKRKRRKIDKQQRRISRLNARSITALILAGQEFDFFNYRISRFVIQSIARFGTPERAYDLLTDRWSNAQLRKMRQ